MGSRTDHGVLQGPEAHFVKSQRVGRGPYDDGMLAPEWSWWTAMPVVVAMVAYLWIPGTALASGLGARLWPALVLGPLMTTALVAGGGIVTGALGIRWGIGVALVWLLAVPGAVWLVRWFVLRSRGGASWRFAPPPVIWWEVGVGLIGSLLIGCYVFYAGAVRPGNVAQGSDAVYHLGLVRYMLDTGTISSLVADGFNHPATPSFYPAAFHGVTATFVLFTGTPIVVAESVLLLVSCALIFPVGMMLMLNTLVATDRRLVLLAGFLSLSVTAFPWRVLVWGPVWAQLYGSVFIPALLAVFGWGLMTVFRGENWVSPALLFLVGLGGLVLAHTSAALGAIAGGILLGLAVAVRHALTVRRGVIGWLPAGAFVVFGVAAPLVGVLVVPPGQDTPTVAHLTIPQIVSGLLTSWYGRNTVELQGGFLITLLAVIGGGVALRRKDQWWLSAIAAVFYAVTSFTYARGSALVWPLTWPWYNGSYRVHGAAAVYMVPLVIVGLAWLLGLAGEWRTRTQTIAWRVVVCVAALGLIFVQTRAAVAMVGTIYKLKGQAAWITSTEARALERLSRAMPPDAVVAADPLRGSQFLYLLGPQRTAIPSEKASGSDVELLGSSIHKVASDPAVCAAVKRLNVTYAITGGVVVRGFESYDPPFAGLAAISEEGGFRVVARDSGYVLWQVPDCRS